MNARLQRAINRTEKLRVSDVVTVDFETHKIEPLPKYPPKAVGVAYKINGSIADYFCWGHPTENNVTRSWDVGVLLKTAWQSKAKLLFHNAKFDLAVARRWFCLQEEALAPRLYDTMLEAFLVDPDNPQLSLKPLAEKYLDWPAEEQAELRGWIVQNVAAARRAPKQWGAYIAQAPGKLVGKYAIGDVDRTYALHELFMPKIEVGYLSDAYRRERACVPMLMAWERQGIPIDRARLEEDAGRGLADLSRVQMWLATKLGIEVADLGKREVLADALEDVDALEEWILTDTGQRSVSIANLREVLLDQEILGAMEYRALLGHQLNTFAIPWLEMSETESCIFPSWNQVRQTSERQVGRAVGTRTSRLSTTPNVQNIPDVVRPVTVSPRVKASNPHAILVPLRGLKLLDLRSYVQARAGRTLINFDYSQQELRILAHYAGGSLRKKYLVDPKFDQHQEATTRINALLGTNFSRKQIKTVGFGILYAMGLDLLAETIGTDRETASTVRNAYKDAFPEIRKLEDWCKTQGVQGGHVRTWGGRRYCAEPAKDGRTFEYKLLNRLIQGSAADVLKEACLRYHNDPDRGGTILMTVHDEIMVECRKSNEQREFNRLKKHMESVTFTLPMPTDGHTGKTWRECK